MTHKYPRWSELTSEQQKQFGNGCGAKWMPKWLINIMFGWFFQASCRRHDWGYTVGGNEFRRWRCDLLFAGAMWRDVKRLRCLLLRPPATIAMVVYYAAVTLFGWTRFHYGRPRTLQETLNADN